MRSRYWQKPFDPAQLTVGVYRVFWGRVIPRSLMLLRFSHIYNAFALLLHRRPKAHSLNGWRGGNCAKGNDQRHINLCVNHF